MKEVRSLQLADYQLIGDIIADSFSDDPINLWVFRSQTAMKYYFSLAAKKLYLQQGFSHAVFDRDSSGLGGTLWLPPNVSKSIPLWRCLDIVYYMARHSGIGAVLRGLKVDEALTRHKPKQPHYYLYCIGARQACQGKGVGSLVMNAGLEIADKEGMPVYLESTKQSNVPYYQRFGFEVTEPFEPAAGCPTIFPMWRPAQ